MPKKSIKKKEPTAVVTVGKVSDWLEGVDMSSETNTIPRIYMAQEKSPPVNEGRCRVGQFVDLSTNRVLDTKGKLSVCVFYKTVNCIELEEDPLNKTNEIIRNFPMITDPTHKDYVGRLEYRTPVPNSNKIRTIKKCMNYFVFIKQDGKWEDTMPYVFSFKGFSFKEGKALSTEVYQRLSAKGLPPCAYEIILYAKPAQYKEHQFYVPGFERGDPIPQETQKAAYEWLKLVRTKQVGVSDYEEEAKNTYGAVSTAGEGRSFGEVKKIDRTPEPEQDISTVNAQEFDEESVAGLV